MSPWEHSGANPKGVRARAALRRVGPEPGLGSRVELGLEVWVRVSWP